MADEEEKPPSEPVGRRGRPKGSPSRPRVRERDKGPVRPRGTRYPPGIPVDENGSPLGETVLSNTEAKQLRKIGVFDSESARVLQMTKKFRERRESGEKNIRWEGPDSIKFEEMCKEYPAAWIRFQQVEPVIDDNVPATSVAAANSWPKLVEHLRTRHWRGEAAVYKWYIYDNTNYQHAGGKVNFAARQQDDDPIQTVTQQAPYNPYYPYGMPGASPHGQMMPNPMQPPPMPGMPGMPPQWPGYPMQNIGAPPQPQMVPMPVPWPVPQQPQQAQPQAPQAPPPPVPQPMPFPSGAGMLDPNMAAMLMQLTRENQQLLEQLRQQQGQQTQQPQQNGIPPHMLPYYLQAFPWMFGLAAPPGAQHPPQPAKKEEPKQEPPLSPLDMASKGFQEMIAMHRLTKKMVNEFSPQEEKEPEKPPTPEPEMDLPHVIKELPHMRAVFDRASGMPVDGVTMAMYNGDKIIDAAKSMFKEARGMISDMTDQKKKAQETEIEIRQKRLQQEEQALQQGERMVAIAERMREHGVTLAPVPDASFTPPPAPSPGPNGEGQTPAS